MASYARQVCSFAPTPTNFGDMGGAPLRSYAAFANATLPNSLIVIMGQIAFFAGNTVTGAFDFNDGTNLAAYTQLDVLQTPSGGACDTRSFYKENAPSIPAGYRGKATGGGSGFCIDTTQSWATNQWVGYQITAAGGGNAIVTSNTATQLNFTGISFASGDYYVVGGYVGCKYSAFDDYDGVFAVEIAGTSGIGAMAGHSARTDNVGSGTDNVGTGNTATLPAGSYGVFGFSFNDKGLGTPIPPAPGTGNTDLGTCWIWDVGQTNARAQFRNAILGSPATLSSLFSSNGSTEFNSFVVVAQDAPPVQQSPGYAMSEDLYM